MNFRFSSLLEYTLWLLKKYHAYSKLQGNDNYRIVEIKKMNCGQYNLIVQVIGKSSILECTPHEIVKNDRLLESFSKKDIRTITYLACDPIKPKYKIHTQEFSENEKQIFFKIHENKHNIIAKKTANQIMMDKNIMDNLSKEDILSIVYIAGYECAENSNYTA
jgi:hypothetical protein